MIFYVAGIHVALSAALGATNLLVSYAYPSTVKVLSQIQLPTGGRKFLDSGAFTAFKQGKPINIKDYCGYLKAHGMGWDIYATLDVIGDEDATMANLHYMEKEGLAPLPVFHPPSGRWDILKQLLQRYEYIAIGGIAECKRKTRITLLNQVFALNSQYNRKLHGFGVSDFLLLKMFPFYSADSSSAELRVAFGGFLSTPRKGGTKQECTVRTGLLGANARAKDVGAVSWSGDLVGGHTVDPNDGYTRRYKVSLAHTFQQVKEITDLWTARGVTWKD